MGDSRVPSRGAQREPTSEAVGCSSWWPNMHQCRSWVQAGSRSKEGTLQRGAWSGSSDAQNAPGSSPYYVAGLEALMQARCKVLLNSPRSPGSFESR